MNSIKEFINRHPVWTYFALVFAISWGGIVAVFGPTGLPATAEAFANLGPVVYAAMLLGPAVSGILMTILVSGTTGLREIWSRTLKWRVDVRWWAAALLTAPIAVAAVLFALSLLSPGFLPGILSSSDRDGLLLTGVLIGLVVGVFEEIGWTGFAIPRLRMRYGIIATGLIVGVPWGAWHFLTFWEVDTFTGLYPLALLIGRLFTWLPAFRVLMVVVYDRTGSALRTGGLNRVVRPKNQPPACVSGAPLRAGPAR